MPNKDERNEPNSLDQLLDALETEGFVRPYSLNRRFKTMKEQNAAQDEIQQLNRHALLTALTNSGWAAS